MIEVINISKSYENKILDNISFNVEPGTVNVITGASGIGKTTLFGIMMGIISADEGQIRGMSQNISAVFQEDRLIDELSVLYNIRLVTNKSDIEICNECLRLLEIGTCHKKVSLLSGGMKRRVAILRAMIAESDVIFMDEPFKGLDNDTKSAVIEYVLEKKNGRTLFVITHDMVEIKKLKPVQVIDIK